MAFDYYHRGSIDSGREQGGLEPIELAIVGGRAGRRQAVALQERDRRTIEVTGERVVTRLIAQLNAAVLRTFEQGGDVVALIRERLDKDFMPVIQRAMVASHLTGRVRSGRFAAVKLRKSKTMAAYDDALTWLQKRLALTPEERQNLMDIYGNEAALVTREASVAAEDAAQRAIIKIVESGQHVREGVATLRRELQQTGVGPLSPAVLNTLVRTQTQMSYSAGKWNADQDAAIQEILWGYLYSTVGDDRVRPTHEAMDGVQMPKDDPIWKVWTPPAGFNCRCALVSIFLGDPDAVVVEPPDTFTAFDGTVVTDPQPDEGWAFNPGELFRDEIT